MKIQNRVDCWRSGEKEKKTQKVQHKAIYSDKTRQNAKFRGGLTFRVFLIWKIRVDCPVSGSTFGQRLNYNHSAHLCMHVVCTCDRDSKETIASHSVTESQVIGLFALTSTLSDMTGLIVTCRQRGRTFARCPASLAVADWPDLPYTVSSGSALRRSGDCRCGHASCEWHGGRPLWKCLRNSPQNSAIRPSNLGLIYCGWILTKWISILQSADKQGNPSFHFHAPDSKRRHPWHTLKQHRLS